MLHLLITEAYPRMTLGAIKLAAKLALDRSYGPLDLMAISKKCGNAQRSHKRSTMSEGKAAGYATTFCRWDYFYVGESTTSRITQKNPTDVNMLRVSRYPVSTNYNEMRDLDAGGPEKYILRPVKIRDPSTQWLWIDGTVPLRAIYFPVALTTDEAYPDLCTYAVIDFRKKNSVNLINIETGESVEFYITEKLGLDFKDGWSWGFNIPDIITYLCIPHKLRNPQEGLYSPTTPGDELVVFAPSDINWVSANGISAPAGEFEREIDYSKVLSATFGVEVGWRPYEYSSFIGSLIGQVVGLGLGFIPGVGPLLSVGFGMAVQLIEDPESFRVENILDLSAAILDSVLPFKGKKYLAPGFLSKNSGSYDVNSSKRKPLTEEERARRKELGDELNARLSEGLGRKVVLLSLLERDLLLQGTANAGDRQIEEVEVTDPDAASNA
ncbi:hypothetical protein R1sor_022339 [Riccia sorocarpa]|uniref:Uncharacterized protein n=1 Tax=Riccia sorocarpa TaxID=122646 RepID=A0ABD3GJL3_9MARC